MTAGDVTVLGMAMGVFHVEDIGVMVPQGVVVTIHARDALRSKDLWRAISQNILFRLKTGPNEMLVDRPQQQELKRIEVLEDQNESLKAAFEEQKVRNDELLRAMQEQHVLLKALMDRISTGVPTVPKSPSYVRPIDSSPACPVVETVEIPMFVPSVIKPENVSTRIGKIENEVEDTLNDAQSKLRKMRNNNK